MTNLTDLPDSINSNKTLILVLLNAFFGLCALSICCSVSGVYLYNHIPSNRDTVIAAVDQPITPFENTPTMLQTNTNLPIIEPSYTIPATQLILHTKTEIPPTEKITFMTIDIPLAEGVPCIPLNTTRQLGLVTSIIDGDTINVLIDGKPFTVRYIGMDTPESGQTYGTEATNANSRIINNQPIILIKDQSETDRYDRLLRYVIANDKFVNYELIKQGYASAKDYPPDSSCSNTFSGAEQSARSEEIGLWVVYAFQPTSTPMISILPTSTSGFSIPKTSTPNVSNPNTNCDPHYPTICIPPPPPDIDCHAIPQYKNFTVLSPDPHHLDGNDNDGIGCEE